MTALNYVEAQHVPLPRDIERHRPKIVDRTSLVSELRKINPQAGIRPASNGNPAHFSVVIRNKPQMVNGELTASVTVVVPAVDDAFLGDPMTVQNCLSQLRAWTKANQPAPVNEPAAVAAAAATTKSAEPEPAAEAKPLNQPGRRVVLDELRRRCRSLGLNDSGDQAELMERIALAEQAELNELAADGGKAGA